MNDVVTSVRILGTIYHLSKIKVLMIPLLKL